jgi:hypothetical protein
MELARQLGIDPISGQLELAAAMLARWRDLEAQPMPTNAKAKEARLKQLQGYADAASGYLAKAAPYIRPRLAVVDARAAGSVKTHEEALAELEGGPVTSVAKAAHQAAFGDEDDEEDGVE